MKALKLTVLCVGTPRRPLGRPIAVYEGRALLARLPDRTRTFALTRAGDPASSLDVASELREISTYGPGGAAWLIGGAFGLSEQVTDAADRQVSLSHLTLPRELARLILVEQLYRAGTILRGEPYHKSC